MGRLQMPDPSVCLYLRKEHVEHISSTIWIIRLCLDVLLHGHLTQEYTHTVHVQLFHGVSENTKQL